MTGRCFACDRRLGRNPAVAHCRDQQWVFVGSECFKLIRAAGNAGWQPPMGGPRLYAKKQYPGSYEIEPPRSTQP